MDGNELIDIGWLMACAALVFIMQAGFCCLESGLVRTKNSINVAIKNLIDVCIAGMLFWLFGYGLLFGQSQFGLIGSDQFLFEPSSARAAVVFLFHLMFCGAATTIVAGAVAERMRFAGYLAVAIVISGVIYPVFGHWAWSDHGWLAELGFVDFAGSTVVHGVGAWVALAVCIVIGPRIGRFDKNGEAELFGHNVPLATIGVMLLWFGWFGFNGGSRLALDQTVPLIVAATVISGMAGGLSAMAFAWTITKRPDVLLVMNGVLGGLVSITASCNLVSLGSAVCIGGIGGVVAVSATWGVAKLKIDDAVSAIPVHGCAGVWGTLAVALFAADGTLGNTLTRFEQLGVQALGIAVAFAWAFGVGFPLFWAINLAVKLRVSRKAELSGLNIAEHQARNESHLLLSAMESHRRDGNFSEPIPMESYTEVGQIAAQYNRVLSAVHHNQTDLLEANYTVGLANADLHRAKLELEERLGELAEFNDIAVDRELRMIELKRQVNELSIRQGKTPPYDLSLDSPELTHS